MGGRLDPFLGFCFRGEVCGETVVEGEERRSLLVCRNKQGPVAVFLEQNGFAFGNEPLSLFGLAFLN